MNELIEILRGMADMLDGPQNIGNLIVPSIINRLRDASNAIERFEVENAALREELAGKSKEIDRCQQWVNDLQSGMYVNCVYCGHRYGPADTAPVSMAEVLKQHVEQCPAHPMSQLKTDLARVTAERDSLRAQQEHPNEPLTLDELRHMDREPVWLYTFSSVRKKTSISQWAILEAVTDTDAVFVRAGCNCRLIKWFSNYGETWLAYRRKPEWEAR